MNRNGYPAWLNRLIDRIADSPTSLIGKVAARRMGRPAPRGTVPATRFDDRPTRVLIAPVNYSGQALAWARALEKADPLISARSMAVDVPGGFSFASDLVVPVGTYHNDPDWQRRQFAAATSATHVLIEAEEPPFGRLLGRSVQAQADALTAAGVDVAFLAHGTDARLPSRHIRNNPLSYYLDDSVYLPRAEELAARNIALLERSGRPVFVSTPDLLVDLPGAVWCPVVIDPERWRTDRATTSRSRPLRVAHAPSVAATKGTAMILPVLERLAAEGLIELSLIQGVPSAQMPAAFARVDVLLDQFRAGSYGVAACEAMAAGCVVVGQVSDQVREVVRRTTGHDLPIIEADPDTLEQALRELAARTDLDGLRAQSVAFVRAAHDGTLSARALKDAWLTGSTIPGRGADAQRG
ncbi:glycosyltransferase family protein [Microbacterium xylanilyticum]